MSDQTPPVKLESQAAPAYSRPELDDEISLFELGSTLLEQRRLIVIVTLTVAVLAVLPALFVRSSFTSSAMVISAQAGGGDARLQGLAGQFGINLGGSGGTPTTAPAFLVELAQSRVILERVLGDTVVVSGEGPVAIIDWVAPLDEDSEIQPAEAQRFERAVRNLRGQVSIQEVRTLGAVRIGVSTDSPEVSHHLARRLLEELDRFNQELGQGRAAEERRFVESRLAEQEVALRQAESRLAAFLESNRQFRNSPELTFEHDRLQREVGLQQQVLVGLAQSREDIRLRAVRDTPVLTVIEPPMLPLQPDPKGRVRRGILGLLVGGLLGVISAFVVGLVGTHRASQDPEVQRFMGLLRESFSFGRGRTKKEA